MGYKLELSLPSAGKGNVHIDGLGAFENGKSYDIDDDQADTFRHYHQKRVEVVDDKTGQVTSVTMELGPTLLEYFKNTEGVTVTTATDEDDKKKKDPGKNQGGKTPPVDPEKDKGGADGSGEGGK